MNYPGVLVFDDKSYKIINSESELLKDYIWAQIQYMTKDIFVDNLGNQYRLCARDIEEDFIDTLANEVAREIASVDAPYTRKELIDLLNSSCSSSDRKVIKVIICNLSSGCET